jgi:hypothetical protein
MTEHIVPYFTTATPSRPPGIHAADRVVAVPLDVPGDPHVVGTNVWDELSRHRLTPSPEAVDLYRLAVLVYTADTRVYRSRGYDAWSRDFSVHLPVHDLTRWRASKPDLESLLGFLSGDRWTLELSAGAPDQPARNENLWERGSSFLADAVMLFSGGLDSFIGAADGLAAGQKLLLVGHYDHPTTSIPQGTAFAAIAGRFVGAAVQLGLYVLPPTNLTGESETSTRSRSFLFMSLAALVASGTPETDRLVIPENGLIALNAPLTSTRLGSLSTRTAHPHTLALMRRALAALGMPQQIEAPYAFQTKGEMVAGSGVRGFILGSTSQTMSCAHPGVDHWQKGGSAFQHCGYCLPCLIRRAALSHAGQDNTAYTYDVLTTPPPEGERRQDLRAVLAALERAPGRSAAASVLRSGPLSDAPDDIDRYVDVYRRGLAEVEAFLARRSIQTI